MGVSIEAIPLILSILIRLHWKTSRSWQGLDEVYFSYCKAFYVTRWFGICVQTMQIKIVVHWSLQIGQRWGKQFCLVSKSGFVDSVHRELSTALRYPQHIIQLIWGRLDDKTRKITSTGTKTPCVKLYKTLIQSVSYLFCRYTSASGKLFSWRPCAPTNKRLTESQLHTQLIRRRPI